MRFAISILFSCHLSLSPSLSLIRAQQMHRRFQFFRHRPDPHTLPPLLHFLIAAVGRGRCPPLQRLSLCCSLPRHPIDVAILYSCGQATASSPFPVLPVVLPLVDMPPKLSLSSLPSSSSSSSLPSRSHGLPSAPPPLLPRPPPRPPAPARHRPPILLLSASSGPAR